MEFSIREYQKEDFQDLVAIIRKTWHYDEFCSPSVALKLSKLYLISCLTDSTYSRVALQNGKPVGLILGKNIKAHHCPFHLKVKQFFEIAALCLSKEGRTVSKMFQSIECIDQELLKDCQKPYPAELVLFAVDSSLRGNGIGKMLFQSFLDYMKEQHMEEFYLFTDTTCNYGFYEHQGMSRRSETSKRFDIKGQLAKMRFFIYDYEL